MKLILVIDRDDDIGRKAKIKTPVIGRENCLNAAVKLALSDPEDSDVNAIFQAVRLYDELKNAEVAIVSGDEAVGVVSDTKIAKELDELKKLVNAESVIVVTDGSEDEFVLPIVSSRFKIDGVSRVVVKQSRTIESTYYLIKKLFEDPKIAKATLAPLGLILVVYAILTLTGKSYMAAGGVLLIFGLYMILKAYGMENYVEGVMENLKKSLQEGKITFITNLTAILIFIAGLIQGFNEFWKVYTQPVAAGVIILATSFVYGAVWWIVGASLFVSFGKILDGLLEGKSVRRMLASPFFIISAGLLFYGSSVLILSWSGYFEELQRKAISDFLYSIFGAIVLSLIGVFISRTK